MSAAKGKLRRHLQTQAARFTGVLDPLLGEGEGGRERKREESLTFFMDMEHLDSKVRRLYCELDVDNSGGVSFEEFRK
eukprot:757844-Hanusia_phi.AAC.1